MSRGRGKQLPLERVPGFEGRVPFQGPRRTTETLKNDTKEQKVKADNPQHYDLNPVPKSSRERIPGFEDRMPFRGPRRPNETEQNFQDDTMQKYDKIKPIPKSSREFAKSEWDSDESDWVRQFCIYGCY